MRQPVAATFSPNAQTPLDRRVEEIEVALGQVIVRVNELGEQPTVVAETTVVEVELEKPEIEEQPVAEVEEVVYEPEEPAVEEGTPANLWNREPAMVRAFIGSVISLAASFGLDLSGEQTGALMAVVTLGLGLWTRSKVTPVS